MSKTNGIHQRIADLVIGEAEKALTPTDDEREALLREADALVASWDQRGSWSSDSPVGMVMRLAAALRRSEVPEPRAWHDVAAFLERRGLADGGIADFIRENAPEPQGEPSNRVIAMCARCGLFPVVGGDEINSDIVVCDRCAFAEGRESAQGEPSDARAKVIDALVMTRLSDFAGTDMGVIEQAADAVLAALRAAGGAR